MGLPAPRPSVNRPPERSATVLAAIASRAGDLERVDTTLVINLTLDVTRAAAARTLKASESANSPHVTPSRPAASAERTSETSRDGGNPYPMGRARCSSGRPAISPDQSHVGAGGL